MPEPGPRAAFRLTAVTISLMLVVAGGAAGTTFFAARRAMKELVRAELTGVASLVAADLGGSGAATIAALRPGDETTADFMNLRNRLARMRSSHPDFRYIHVMRRTAAGQVEFVVDADYGNKADPGAAIGQVYWEVTPALLAGFDHPAADEKVAKDQWGSFLSGFAPIRSPDGTVVGIVGVDMTDDRLTAKERVDGALTYAILGLGILTAGLLASVLHLRVAREHFGRGAQVTATGSRESEETLADVWQ